MKTVHYIVLIIITLLPTFHGKSQTLSRWNYGLSGHYSSESYKMAYTTLYTDRPNINYEKSVKSALAGGIGVWAERRFSSYAALASRIDYNSVRIDEEFFSGWYIKVGGGRDYQEWHRSLSLSLVGRVYLPTRSKVKINLDAGFKADRIINFRSRYANFDFRRWNHPYFSDFAPAWVAGLGLQYGRLGLSLEYHDFPWNDALTKKMADNLKMGLLNQQVGRSGLTINANFRLNRQSKP